MRCHYYLSLIHCKTGAFDRSLPLAEDCLSCAGLVGADREAFIDYRFPPPDGQGVDHISRKQF